MELKPFGEKSYDFIMRPWQEDARITILEGAVRSSKTVTILPKIISLAKQGPPGLRIITGVSKSTIYDNVLRDLFDVVGNRNHGYNRQTGDLRLFGSAWKVVGAKDEGSEKFIRGGTYAIAVCDELVLQPESFFKQLLNRLSVENAKLYGTTNPDIPTHYLYKEFITDKDKLASGMVRVIHFDLDDNPNLSEEYKAFIRNSYAGVFYQRFIEGKWVVAEGAIYRDAWSDDLLFDDGEEPRDFVDRYIAVDYGTTNPCAFLDIRDDGDTAWQVNEYYWDSRKEMRQKTDSEYADDFEKFVGKGPDAIAIVDPSAASFKAELRSRGIAVIDADNDVGDGIRLTSTMFKRRKYRVNRKCTKTREEIPGYQWNKKAAEERGKEEPVKENDHTCDAVRYFVKTIIKPWRLAA